MAKKLVAGLLACSLIAAAGWAGEPTTGTIAPGTVITAQNWRQYKDFMPVGLQKILQGDTIWRLPQGWEMEVGATVDYPLPRAYWDATEKYRNQARLVPLPTGGYTIQGYNSGAPFPDYSGTLAGYKILYNVYYHYPGEINYFTSFSPEVDRYLNATVFTAFGIYARIAHGVHPGFSHEREMPGYYEAFYGEVLTPEQEKYTASDELIFDDPNTVPEFYVFVPALRRALRLSGGARCAPYLGTDYVGDDVFGYIPLPVGWFNARFQGHRKMLMFRPEPGNRAQFDSKNFYPPIWFPKPVVGKWQLFDALVVDVTRVPSLQKGYCYGLRRMYVDPRSWVPQYVDLWDSSMKFWKMAAALESPHPVPGGGFLINVRGVNWIIDFQNLHASIAVVGKDTFAVNEEVPEQYRDLSRYGSPAGLQKILQ
jgi:hypothetical protein